MTNKDLMTVRRFYESETILIEGVKQVSYVARISGESAAPGKFCKLRPCYCLNIAFMAVEIA